jgi:hypothetical protein
MRALALNLVENISMVFEYLWSSHAECHGSCCTTVSVHLPNVTPPPLPSPPHSVEYSGRKVRPAVSMPTRYRIDTWIPRQTYLRANFSDTIVVLLFCYEK